MLLIDFNEMYFNLYSKDYYKNYSTKKEQI